MAHAPPDALLLIAPDCPHCPTVLEGLATLVKGGEVGRLEVVSLAVHPRRAEELGVRSVPWTRIGPFVVEGATTLAELRRLAALVDDDAGWAQWFERQLESGGLARAEAAVREVPGRLRALVRLLAEPHTAIHVRLGIGAIFEGLPADGGGEPAVEPLGALTRHPDPRVRADACHCLACTGSENALPYLTACTADADGEVREIAAEGLEKLGG